MSNKLILEKDGVLVVKNHFLSVFLKWLSILVILICGLFAYMMIKKMSGWWRFLSIPIAVIFATYYTFCYAGVGKSTSEIILKITPSILLQSEMNVEIPVKRIVAVVDRSIYYDFNGNGPSNKGWHHVIDIEYLTDSNKKTFHLVGLGLSHADHLRVVDYLNSVLPLCKSI